MVILNEASPWCDCQDFQKFVNGRKHHAPDGWCKHRIAAWIVHERERDALPAQLRDNLNRRIGRMENAQAPSNLSLKLEKDGSTRQIHTERADTAEDLEIASPSCGHPTRESGGY